MVNSVDRLVEFPDERDSLQVLSATVLVRDPFSFLARVVEIDHRGNSIDPQPIRMILIQPEERTAHQKRADLVLPKVEDIAVPVRMVALPRIRILVEMRSIIVGKPVGVRREVARNP